MHFASFPLPQGFGLCCSFLVPSWVDAGFARVLEDVNCWLWQVYGLVYWHWCGPKCWNGLFDPSSMNKRLLLAIYIHYMITVYSLLCSIVAKESQTRKASHGMEIQSCSHSWFNTTQLALHKCHHLPTIFAFTRYSPFAFDDSINQQFKINRVRFTIKQRGLLTAGSPIPSWFCLITHFSLSH